MRQKLSIQHIWPYRGDALGGYRTYTIYKCKKLQFIHKLTASDTSKTAKNYKKVILLSSTLTFRRCADGVITFL